ncbi:phosphatase PAP2 family protein [Celerinatantimonas yamalensis]|uniref:Phosphatase PAP2 family protein n=1 Tax=Celerinatantimonas yamalensis TaxID=559956 RepID=A0ABW9G6V7_9GAMM
MNTATKIYLKKLTRRRDIWLSVLTTLPFVLFPQLDIWTSQQFFHNEHFFLANDFWVEVMYKIFANIQFVLIPLLLLPLIWISVKKSNSATLLCWRKKLLFLALCLALGPGILVNVVLKDNSVGRPRPIQVHQFGGQSDFAPVLRYSGECRRNCSFVSGHAAIAFYFIVLAWAFRNRNLFIVGVLLGCLVGFVRIVQGGHFLSDVIFAFWADYWTFVSIALLFRYPLPKKCPSQCPHQFN